MRRWFFRYVGTKTFASSCKNQDFWPKNGQIWPKIGIFGHFGPNICIFGPFRPMPDQKTMRTRCVGGFSVMWVPKQTFAFSSKNQDFLPKKRPNWHFWAFWARPCWLIWCPVGGLASGCGVRALSRKTTIYFILFNFVTCL